MSATEKKLDLNRTAFAVCHVQNDIVTPKGAFAFAGIHKQVEKYGTLEKIAQGLEATRKAGIMVIYVNVTWKPGYPEDGMTLFQTFEILLGGVRKGAYKPGSWGWSNPEIVKPQSTDIIVENPAADGFMYTDFDLYLRGREVKDLILTGTATNWVINSTTRHACELGYNVTVIEDCVQSFNDEMHNFAIEHELPLLAQIWKLDDYLNSIS